MIEKGKQMFLRSLMVGAVASLFVGSHADAQEWYVSGSIGLAQQNDSDNAGQTGAFTTGNLGDGSTLDVAAGTGYGWTTEFDSGTVVSGEIGVRSGNNIRAGIEISYQNADVDTHKNVTLGGGSIDAVDAAALASSADPLNVTVGDLVADGRGEIESTSVFANIYYDFGDGALQPYLGGGLGFSDVSVTYQPSGVGVIDDGETKFAYQVKAGATYDFGNNWEAFGEYTYRATDDIEVNNSLFPGDLNIENQSNLFSVGARYRFG